MELRPAVTASLSASKRDKWIPWYFVAFFVAIAIVDGAFVTIAIRSQTGVVTERAYEKGLAYNDILSEAAAQKDLGIEGRAEFKNDEIIWNLVDKDGKPLNGIVATVHFYRPTQEGYDFKIELNDLGGGIYSARPKFPLPGLWKARFEATWQDTLSQQKQRYQAKLELIVP